MDTITRKCPHCGNIVEGKIQRSTASRFARTAIKKGGMKTVLAVAGSVVPGVGNGLGFVAGTTIDALWGDKINNVVDKTADYFMEDNIYSFSCPNCGNTWSTSTESSNELAENGDIDLSSWESIAAKVVYIIVDTTHCRYNDIKDDIYVSHLGASKIQQTSIIKDLEKMFEINIPDDFLDDNTIHEIVDAIFDYYNPDEFEEVDNEVYGEHYMKQRRMDEISHYCLYVVNSDKSVPYEYKNLVNRIKQDLKIKIDDWQIKAEDKQGVYDKLMELVCCNINDDFNWHNLITTLPHDKQTSPLNIEVYSTGYWQGHGFYISGVVLAGNVSVGDEIIICTNNGSQYKNKVAWIEMFNKFLATAEAGDSFGLGLEFDITFDDTIQSISSHQETSACNIIANSSEEYNNDLTEDEQEYLDNLKEFLEDDAEITPRERKMLDRIRQSLGISEERAKELEASLKPELTEDEQEYLDNLKEFLEDDAEITPRERKMLDRIRQSLGISEERAKELETSLKPVRDID